MTEMQALKGTYKWRSELPLPWLLEVVEARLIKYRRQKSSKTDELWGRRLEQVYMPEYVWRTNNINEKAVALAAPSVAELLFYTTCS